MTRRPFEGYSDAGLHGLLTQYQREAREWGEKAEAEQSRGRVVSAARNRRIAQPAADAAAECRAEFRRRGGLE